MNRLVLELLYIALWREPLVNRRRNEGRPKALRLREVRQDFLRMASGHRAGRQGEMLLLQTRAGGRRIAQTASGATSASASGSSTSASGILTGTGGIITGARGFLTRRGVTCGSIICRGITTGTRGSITGACRATAAAGGAEGLRFKV